SDVVRQGIDPHVHDMRRIAGHRNAPVERGTRDREILEPASDETDDLVAPLGRQNELRIGLVVREQLVAVSREAEAGGFLLRPLDGRAERLPANAIGADGRLILLEVRLLAHGVPAGVTVEVDVARIGHAPPELLAGGVVARLGRADEIIVRDIESGEQLTEARRAAVGQRLRGDPFLDGALLHLEAMLVGASEEASLAAIETGEAGHHVAGDRGVGVAEVWLAVGVIDRRRDVEGRAPAHEINAPWASPGARDTLRRADLLRIAAQIEGFRRPRQSARR